MWKLAITLIAVPILFCMCNRRGSDERSRVVLTKANNEARLLLERAKIAFLEEGLQGLDGLDQDLETISRVTFSSDEGVWRMALGKQAHTVSSRVAFEYSFQDPNEVLVSRSMHFSGESRVANPER